MLISVSIHDFTLIYNHVISKLSRNPPETFFSVYSDFEKHVKELLQ